MKKITIICFILMFAFVSFNLEAKKRKIDKLKFPKIRSFKLPEVQKADAVNGIKIRLIEDYKLPLVSLNMLFKGGSGYEIPGKNFGISGVTAQLMRIGGTKTIKSSELDKLLDAKGITIGVNSGTAFFNVSVSCLKENFDEAMSIVAKILQEPAFEKAKLEEILTQQRSAISRQNDQPAPIRDREFDKLIYGKDSVFGAVFEYDDIDRIDINGIKKTHKRYFAPASMLSGLIGPMKMKEVQAIMKKYFSDWKVKPEIPSFAQIKEQKIDCKLAFAQKDSLNQSYISIGHLGLEDKLSVKDKAGIQVFNQILGGGFTGRLMNRVRTKMGLTYGIYGGIGISKLYPGMTSISTYTKSKSTLDAVDAIIDEIQKIQANKVSEQELLDAKDAFNNSFVFKYSTPGQILVSSLVNEFYGVETGYARKLLEEVQKVTVDQVLKVAKDYIKTEKLKILIVGNKKEIKGDLNKYGKVKELDIKIPEPKLKEKIPAATKESLARGLAVIKAGIKKNYSGFKTIKSLEVEMNMKMQTPQGEMSMDSKRTVLYPEKSHVEITVMGMKITRTINGNKGIMNRMGQKIPITAAQIKEGKFADTAEMVNNINDFKFQYLKEVKNDLGTFDLIYLTQKGFEGKWQKLYVNKKTGTFEISESLSPQGLGRTVGSNYKKIKGINFAHKQVTTINNKKFSDVTIKKITVNPKVDKKIFEIKK